MVKEFGLEPKIRFRCNVTGVEWDEQTGVWAIALEGREAVIARTVVMASGPLANVSFPAVPGLESYEGHKIHSARWDHDYDFTDKRVAVIGTGASGVQIVPETRENCTISEGFPTNTGMGIAASKPTHPNLARRICTVVIRSSRGWRVGLGTGDTNR